MTSWSGNPEKWILHLSHFRCKKWTLLEDGDCQWMNFSCMLFLPWMLPSAERCGSTFDDQPQCSLVKTSQQKCQCAYQSGTTQHRVMSPFLQHPGKYRIRPSGFENRSSARSLNLLSMNESRVVRNHFQKEFSWDRRKLPAKFLFTTTFYLK